MKKIYRQLLNLFLVTAIIVGGGIFINSMMTQASVSKTEDEKAGIMEVHFIDVGQEIRR